MVGLLDVNLLIALAWPSHIHHSPARAWFSKHSREGWATCPITQNGFVRISSNPKIIPDAASPREALALLEQVVRLKTHTFWPDDLAVNDKAIPRDLLIGHRQVTDAYLLGLAIHNRGRLVTLDAGLASLLPKSSPHLKSLLIITPGQW